jgi:HEPN domain-containing protein
MRRLTEEWVEKAEADYRVAEREAAVTEEPSYSVVCFLAQQAAEKYMKALLTELGIGFPKTHDLGALLRLVPSGTTALADLRGPLEFLGMHAVESRYPGIDVGESGAH